MIKGKAQYQGSGEVVNYAIFAGDTFLNEKFKDVSSASLWQLGQGTHSVVNTHRGFFTPVSDGDVIVYHDKYTEVMSRPSFKRVYKVLEESGEGTDNLDHSIVLSGNTNFGVPKTPMLDRPRGKYQDRDINNLAFEIAQWRATKGFQTPSKFKDHSSILIKLMLIVSELSEASEAVRANDEDNFREELADTIIRILDLTGTMGIDIASEIHKKMLVNEKRPQKHGKSI